MSTPGNDPASFYSPGAERAQRVEDLFGKIAARYDLINDLQSFGLHRGWKRRLTTLAQVGKGQRALDICCGTGDVAFRMQESGADVVGLDFSEPMLRVAQRRVEPQRPLCLLRGDALKLPFSSESLDAVTISYGLRNLADLHAGLAEMVRVLKRGGKLLILDFGKPEQPLWRAIYFQYLRRVVPIFGGLFCGNSATHAYILESLMKYPGQKEIALRMEQAGCEGVEAINLLGGVMSIHAGQKQSGSSKKKISKNT